MEDHLEWCCHVGDMPAGQVKDGGKVGQVGGSIADMWLSKFWETVPSTVFYKVEYQPVEGAMDVFSGDVRSGAAGRRGRA